MHDGNIRKLLNQYLDQELAAADKIQVERHLEECPECRLEYERLLKVHKLSLLVEPPVPSEDALESLAIRIRRTIARERPPRRRSRVLFPSFQLWPQVASAAVILFVAGMSLVVILRLEEGKHLALPGTRDKEIPRLAMTASEEDSGRAKTAGKSAPPVARGDVVGKKAAEEKAGARRPDQKTAKDEVATTAPTGPKPAPAAGTVAGAAARGDARGQAIEAEAPAGSEARATKTAAPVPVTTLEKKRETTSRTLVPDLEFAQQEACDELVLNYDVGPQLLESVEVKVLDDQDRSRLRREVTLNVMVDTLGNVALANIMRSSGDLKQDSAILNTVRQYRFEPAQYRQRRVKAQTVLRVQLKD